jgi:LuxR family maltose regulon positive regulatory protein
MGATAQLVSVLVLQASADEAEDRRSGAIRHLIEAVRLGSPGWYVRRVVEGGASLAHLLPFVRTSAPSFVDAVSAALTQGHGHGTVRAGPDVVLELLTRREVDVLRLLATGARNAEIGESLGVSAGTARWHVANVLAKLGEPSRARAVARARTLGLV